MSRKSKLPSGAITSSSLIPVVPAAPETLSHPPSPAPPAIVPAYVEGPPTEAVPVPGLVRVTLKQQVVINGQKFEPGLAELPAEAYDCWKHAV